MKTQKPYHTFGYRNYNYFLTFTFKIFDNVDFTIFEVSLYKVDMLALRPL